MPDKGEVNSERPKIVKLERKPSSKDIWTPTEHYDDYGRRIVEHTTGVTPFKLKYEGLIQLPLIPNQPPVLIVFPIPNVLSREAAFAVWDDLAEVAANDRVYSLIERQKQMQMQMQSKILVPGEDMPPMPPMSPEDMEKIMKLRPR